MNTCRPKWMNEWKAKDQKDEWKCIWNTNIKYIYTSNVFLPRLKIRDAASMKGKREWMAPNLQGFNEWKIWNKQTRKFKENSLSFNYHQLKDLNNNISLWYK